ncbi:MAG: PTS transporter subunit EIIB [Bowdeniella nasicola]|nr:PTS transporter subunit EIIB [Bowdeniella nasicola]
MSKAADVIATLGGKDNIELMESCITRLRVQVRDVKGVDEKACTALDGVHGVHVSGHVVQVVVGPVAEELADEINSLLK